MNSMSSHTATCNKRVQESLVFSQKLIENYKRTIAFNMFGYYGSQSAVIILSGITPLLILFKIPSEMAAIPPAIASVAAGLSNTFRYRDKYVISKITLEELVFERKKFELGLSPYEKKEVEDENSQQNVVGVFIRNFEIIHRQRMEEWQKIQKIEEWQKIQKESIQLKEILRK